MNSQKLRNGKIELLRFLFALVVVLHHSRELADADGFYLAKSGYLAVEFFFILSGYFLMSSILNKGEIENIGKETRDYLCKKIKALLPNFYFALLVAAVAQGIKWHMQGFHRMQIIVRYFDVIYEFLFIHMAGIGNVRVNGVDWYISAMLLSMAILYPIARKYRDYFMYVGAPLFSIFMIGLLFRSVGHLSLAALPAENLRIHQGLFRALAEISIGCALYPFVQKLKQSSFTPLAEALLSLIELVLYVVILGVMIFAKEKMYDFYVLFLIGLALSLSLSQKGKSMKCFHFSLCSYLGSLSLDLYLAHSYLPSVIKYFFPESSYYSKLIIFLLLSMMSALTIHYLSKAWKNYQIFSKIKRLLIQEIKETN